MLTDDDKQWPGGQAKAVLDDFRAAFANPIEEHGWLIEHEDEPKWLTLRPAEASWSACWTKESSDAVRFCRRSDAEDYVSAHFGGEGPIRITDHIWTGAKP